jgi:hypothetical protein
MKKLLTFIFLLSALSTWAQTGAPSFNDLFINNAPGLILSGNSTISVDKPTTPRSVAVSLVNLAQGGAIEIAPYWWSNHDMTYDEYINKNFVFLQTLSVSLANIKTDSSSTYAPGIRATILRFYSKSGKKAIHDKEAELVDAVTKLNLSKITALQKQLDSIAGKGLVSLDIAAAVLGKPSGKQLQDIDFTKSAIWTNLSWDPNKFPLGFVGMARYAWTGNTINQVKTDARFMEFGAQMNYTTSKFVVEAEYLNRRSLYSAQNYSQLTASLTYAVTDDINVVASYGKPLTSAQPIVALFGINFGFSRNK